MSYQLLLIAAGEMGELRHYSRHEIEAKPVCACTKEENRTRESELEATDINRIVRSYEQSGMLPQVQHARFLDVSELPDYRTAMDQVQLAHKVFLSLDARKRLEFGNDTARFLEFCANPENRVRLEELGIAFKDVKEIPEVRIARDEEAESGSAGGAQ